MSGGIYLGVGGWTFPPWRGVFYPDGLPQAQELHYASRQLTAIEVNGTYYGSQKPESFRRWAAETPDGFVFSVKASRFCTNRKVLGEAGESIQRFLDTGVAELGDKLGPILWQFAGTKRFDPDDMAAFIALLPQSHAGVRLRHVLEPRHESFCTPPFIAMARQAGVGVVLAEADRFPMLADPTADFIYCRLQAGDDAVETAYPPEQLDAWAGRFKTWAAGDIPGDLPLIDPANPAPTTPRDVFAFIIHEGKVRAPAGAMALIERTR